MPYVVAEAPDCMAVDTCGPITPELAQSLAKASVLGQPIAGVSQYVGLESNGAWDIDAQRLAGILEAGLGLWLTQHCLAGQKDASGVDVGWKPSAVLGAQLGAAARRNAVQAGYMSGAHLALDLENIHEQAWGQPTIDFVNAWCDQVAGGYEPLLYVGFRCGLSPQDLYERLPGVQLYWSDCGPRNVVTRGFAMKQHAETRVCGVRVDPDTIGADLLGSRLRWMIRS